MSKLAKIALIISLGAFVIVAMLATVITFPIIIQNVESREEVMGIMFVALVGFGALPCVLAFVLHSMGDDLQIPR